MTPATRLLFWSTTAAIVVTGALYALFAYGMTPADPMDLDNHPWQSPTLQAHVIAAPLWMFTFGVVWHSHVQLRLRIGSRDRRRSGLLLVALSVMMAASGYLLQTSVADWWRQTWIVMHVSMSIAWIGALVVHLSVPLDRGRLEADRGFRGRA